MAKSPRINEMFIIMNLRRFALSYILLWFVCIALTLFLKFYTNINEWMTDDILINADRAILTLSTMTISLAIPTCLATVFASYDQYRSTTIRSLLVKRFPITLLILSAFTALILVILSYTSITQTLIPISRYIMFVAVVFWGMVCTFFLFRSIESMLHFTVKSPHAVIDHLERNALSCDISDPEGYDDFKRNLSAMGNISSDVIQQTGGNDLVILRNLRFLRTLYSNIDQDSKRAWMARSYVLGELARIYRDAVIAQDEKVGRDIIEITSAILADAIHGGASKTEIDRILETYSRYMSDSLSGFSEEMQRLAVSGWFWITASDLTSSRNTTAIETATVRDIPICKGLCNTTYALNSMRQILSGGLRRVSDGSHDEIIVDFLREASGASVHHMGIEDIGSEARDMLDRAMLSYVDWLIEIRPAGGIRYCRSLSVYSARSRKIIRSILPDTAERIDNLIAREALRRASDDDSENDDGTAQVMLIPINADETESLAFAVLFHLADYKPDVNHELSQELYENSQYWMINGDHTKIAIARAIMGL